MIACFGKERKSSEEVIAGSGKGLSYSSLIQEIIFRGLLMRYCSVYETGGTDVITSSSSINAFYFQTQRTIGIVQPSNSQIISLGIYGIHRIDAPSYG